MDQKLLTATDVFNLAGIEDDGREAMSDRRFSGTCVKCGTLQTLSQATHVPSLIVGLVSEYQCKSCGTSLVAVGHWGFLATAETNSGYRLKDYALYPVVADLSFRVGKNKMLLPSTPR